MTIALVISYCALSLSDLTVLRTQNLFHDLKQDVGVGEQISIQGIPRDRLYPTRLFINQHIEGYATAGHMVDEASGTLYVTRFK